MTIIIKAPASVRINASVEIDKMAAGPGDFEASLVKPEAYDLRAKGIMAIMTDIKRRNRRDIVVTTDLKRLSIK
jgi:hypothetical protein